MCALVMQPYCQNTNDVTASDENTCRAIVPLQASAAYKILTEPLRKEDRLAIVPWKAPSLVLRREGGWERMNQVLELVVEKARLCNELRRGSNKRSWLAGEKDLANYFALFASLAEEAEKKGVFPDEKLLLQLCELCVIENPRPSLKEDKIYFSHSEKSLPPSLPIQRRAPPRPLRIKAVMTDYHCWFFRPGPDFSLTGLDKFGNALFCRRDGPLCELKLVNTRGKVSYSEKISGLDGNVVLSCNSEIHCRRRLKDKASGQTRLVYAIYYKPGIGEEKNFDVGWKWREYPAKPVSPLFVSPLGVYSLGLDPADGEILLRNGQTQQKIEAPGGPCVGVGACGHYLQAGEGKALLTSMGEILPVKQDQLLSALVLGENYFIAFRPEKEGKTAFKIYYHRIGRQGQVLDLPPLSGSSCLLAPGSNSNQVKIARRVDEKEFIDMIELDF